MVCGGGGQMHVTSLEPDRGRGAAEVRWPDGGGTGSGSQSSGPQLLCCH